MKKFSSNHQPYPEDENWESDIPPENQYLGLSYNPRRSKADSSQFFSLVFYLIPIIGVFPSLWTLYSRDGTREQITISRLSITITLTWVIGYFLLATGTETSDFAQLRLAILNTFFTSSYFLVSVWLILRTLQGKTQRIPVLTGLSRRLFKIEEGRKQKAGGRRQN